MATEKRLIDANEFFALLMNKSIEVVERVAEDSEDLHLIIMSTPVLTKYVLNSIPTVDAVEVVRCKDCKHYVLHALACRNEYMNGIVPIDGFCSYGERSAE